MPLTRSFKDTVKARSEHDYAFRDALIIEGLRSEIEKAWDGPASPRTVKDIMAAKSAKRRKP